MRKKTSEKSNYERKENILLLLAYASLKHNGESTGIDNIQAEKSRIERVAEYFYKVGNDQEYNTFMIDWLKGNAQDIVYTDKYVYDTPIPDEPFELNIDLFCRKSINI